MSSILNIPYTLDAVFGEPATRFGSIWKVEADEQYLIRSYGGMAAPALFLTCGGLGMLRTFDNRGVESCVHRLAAGSLFFIDERVPVEYFCPPGGRWSFYCYHFTGMTLVDDLRLKREFVYRTRQTEYFAQLSEGVIRDLIGKPAGYAYSADQAFRELVIRLVREQEEQSKVWDRKLADILTAMHRSLDKPANAAEWLEMSGMSRTGFYKAFRKVTGQSPAAYMSELKMRSARLSLETTGYPVKTIARQLAFRDEHHFSKAFKLSVGVSPAFYRAMHNRNRRAPSANPGGSITP